MQDLLLKCVFAVIVPAMLLLDLFVAGKSKKVTLKSAAIWTGIWIGISLLFSLFVYLDAGASKASEFLTAYVIEKALSVDNLFVFILVFKFFTVPEQYHHKVLFYGIVGAIVLRALFIFGGVAIISSTYFTWAGFHLSPLMLAFGLFLIYGGYKSLKSEDDEESDFSNSAGAKLINKLFRGRVLGDYEGDALIVTRPVTKDGIDDGTISNAVRFAKFATPLLIVIAVIEITDLLFATDSIPAIFAVSKDSFILYASNIFAILGLRTMYFLLSNVMHLFTYLKYGLALILAFIGAKMVIAPFFEISSPHSLMFVGGVLVVSIGASLLIKAPPTDTPLTGIDKVVAEESSN